MMSLSSHSMHTSNEKNLQKSAILFGTKSNAYLQINHPIFAYSWLFFPIFTYLRICSKSPTNLLCFLCQISMPIFAYFSSFDLCISYLTFLSVSNYYQLLYLV